MRRCIPVQIRASRALICLLLAAAAPVPAADIASPTESGFADRRTAIHDRVRAGTDEALEDLLGQWKQEIDPGMRRVLQDAVLRFPYGEAEWVRILESTGPQDSRAWAADALGHYGSAASAEALRAAMKDPSAEIRREVYEALARIGDRGVLPDLLRAALQDPDLALRGLAEQAAGAVASRPPPEMDVPSALATLGSPDLPEQNHALKVLSRSADSRALEPLLAISRAASGELQWNTVLALGLLGDHRAVDPLSGLLSTTTGETRYRVVAALARLEDESSIESMAALLQDPEPRTRAVVIRGLASLPGSLPLVSPLLADPSEEVRNEVVHVIPLVAAKGGCTVLEQALSDVSPFIRAESARLLTECGSPGAPVALARLLEDPDMLVRLTAADGLAQLGAISQVEAIRKAVKKARNEDERTELSEILTRLQGEE